jgi:hypothetical protein
MASTKNAPDSDRIDAVAVKLTEVALSDKKNGHSRSGSLDAAGGGSHQSRRTSFSQQDSRRTSFSFSAGDSLAVAMSRLLTLVDLHARHRKVYEAVALASSSQRTALLTPDDGEDYARLNSTEETLHQGMLASFLTKAHTSTDDMSRLLNDSRSRPKKQSSLKALAHANRAAATGDDTLEDTKGSGASDTPSPSRSLRRGSTWMPSKTANEEEEEDDSLTPKLTFKPRLSQNESSSKAVTSPDGVTRVGGFTVSNDPAYVSPIHESMSGKTSSTDASVSRRNEREGLPLGRTDSWWNEEMEGSVHDRHLALDALFKEGFVNRSRSRLALDDEASRSGRGSRASRASSGGAEE